jgi:hypothetical protein
MANSGLPRTTYNLYERAASNDVNKEQTSLGTSLMEMWRMMYGYARGHDSSAISALQYEIPYDYSALGPLRSVVLGGLLVNPQPAFLLVDGGSLVTVLPSGDPEESILTLAKSPGVTDAGALPFPGGPGSGVRWDLLECRPVVNSTTAMRDVFDPVTQVFGSQLVQKLETTTLEFQYKVGTAGALAPPPSPSDGWQPLACIWVPYTAATFDFCAIFDVRPTLSGMEDPNGNAYGPNRRTYHKVQSNYTNFVESLGSAPNRINSYRTHCYASLRGVIQSQFDAINAPFGVNYGKSARTGYSADFKLTATNPGTSLSLATPSFFDGVTASGQVSQYAESSVVVWAANTLYEFGVMFPFGMARFCKLVDYYDALGRRWPSEQNGLSVLATAVSTTALGPRTGGLPKAYQTAQASYLMITLGCLESGNTVGDTGSTMATSSGSWDGWYRFSEDNGTAPYSDAATVGTGTSTARWPGPSSNAPIGKARYMIKITGLENPAATNITAFEYFNGTTRTTDGTNLFYDMGIRRIDMDITGSGQFATPEFECWMHKGVTLVPDDMVISVTSTWLSLPTVNYLAVNLFAQPQSTL